MSWRRGLLRSGWPILPWLCVWSLGPWLWPAQRAQLATQPAPLGALQVGTWHLPDDGPYVLGYASPGPARLAVSDGQGREVVQLVGTGEQAARVVMRRGAYGVRFEAPREAKLMWKVVGRRGDLQYVPNHLLGPPGEAQPRAAAWGPKLWTVAFGLTLLAALVRWHRWRWRGWSLSAKRTFWGCAGVALALRLIGLNGAGPTWDEDVNWVAGANYLENLARFDLGAWAWSWNFQHPPVTKYGLGLAAQLDASYTLARAWSTLMVAAGIGLWALLVRRWWGPLAGWGAGLVAAVLPHLIAHSKIAGHEAAALFWWPMVMAMAATALRRGGLPPTSAAPSATLALSPSARRRLLARLAWVGVALGLAAGSRYINGLLGPVVLLLLWHEAPPPWRGAVLRHALWCVPLSSLLTFIAVWPRLWAGPVAGVRASLSKLQMPHGVEPYMGQLTEQPAWHYHLVYAVATTPVVWLVAALVGVVLTTRAPRSPKTWAWLAIGLMPLAVMASPVRQDGVRYVMPLLLWLTGCAGVGLAWVSAWLRVRALRVAGGLALVVYAGQTLVRVHPYYLDYYGEHVGGARYVQAQRWFETGWWGEGIDQAVAYVNQHAEPAAAVYRDCLAPIHLAWWRYDLWDHLSVEPQAATWIVVDAASTATRAACAPAQFLAYERVFEVQGQGAPLVVVYRRREPAGAVSQ